MKRAKLYAYSIILGFILFTQIPVYFTAITALKGEKEIYSSDITWFPQSPTLDNFRKVLMVEEERDFTTYIINSLGIAGISTLIVIVLGTLGGYAFSKYRFRGSDLLLLLILVIRVIPPVTLLTPLYKLATWLGIYDTWTILIWANVYLFLPFTIWLLKAFFDNVPSELPEAARIDGCSNYGAFRRVVLPTILPGVAAGAILTFLYSWNHFIFALALTSTPRAKTIPVGLYDFVGDFYIDWGSMCAASLVATIPAVIFIILCQKYIVSGLLTGAIK
ncbi:MAG: carbohydrate ABC transporter permease [Desulfobacteria bacterium]|jgi:multiple sugar transport system permease protein